MSPILDGANGREYGDMRDYIGPTLFQPHQARHAIRDAHEKKITPMIGYYSGLASVPITRWLAPMGFDFVWIDWEHCAMNVETMTTMVHETTFLSSGRTIPFVRVPGHDESSIAYALDAGASIVVPHVDTVEQAKQVLSATKFGKRHKGIRSAPPFRYVPNLTDTALEPERGLWESLNNQAALMIQIETLEGVKNLDSILTEVPDIDIVWFGTLDARVSMGLPAGLSIQGDEPEWLDAVELFHSTVTKHNKPYAGFTFATGDGLRKATSNMAMCVITSDTTKLTEMMGELTAAREAVAA
ncbi:hypothetical protein MAP00_004357 [Monascus purpureus]|nr:hypothetical protein MAP00_004357 [Monascus purpureus]